MRPDADVGPCYARGQLAISKAISAGTLAYTLDGSAPRAIPLLISGDEERQLRLALAAQDVEVDLDLGAGG